MESRWTPTCTFLAHFPAVSRYNQVQGAINLWETEQKEKHGNNTYKDYQKETNRTFVASVRRSRVSETTPNTSTSANLMSQKHVCLRLPTFSFVTFLLRCLAQKSSLVCFSIPSRNLTVIHVMYPVFRLVCLLWIFYINGSQQIYRRGGVWWTLGNMGSCAWSHKCAIGFFVVNRIFVVYMIILLLLTNSSLYLVVQYRLRLMSVHICVHPLSLLSPFL